MLELEATLRKRMRNLLAKENIFLHKKNIFLAIALCAIIFIYFLAMMGWLCTRIYKLEAKQKILQRSVKKMELGIGVVPYLGKSTMPYNLAMIPFGEDLGIVVGVKNISIRKVNAPYNPSLIESPSGYDLFFRYDVIDPSLQYSSYSSRIGVVSLNKQFEQTDADYKRIYLQSEYTDDPRVLFVGDQLYLFCNRLDNENPKCRFMCVTNLDPSTHEINHTTNLNMNFNWVEKNWSPFEYIDKSQNSHLLIEYRINPRKLFELPNSQINDLKNVPIASEKGYLNLAWSAKWGEIRGGTPAKKIGNEYLGFFHSSFTDEHNLVWYVMGAYTFSADPPFHLTRISAYPIFFKEIYGTHFANTAPLNKRVIFPSGFVIEKQKDRELIHLACGENDCAVKIVMLDKEQLLKNMVHLQD